jgi:DNA-binding response OmpR family regulator
VEDEEAVAHLIRNTLHEAGMETRVANRGSLSLDALTAHIFDVVILDNMPPDQDAVALVACIRQTSRVPILLFTASPSDEDSARAIEAGADSVVGKPFDPDALVLRVWGLVQRGHARSAATV